MLKKEINSRQKFGTRTKAFRFYLKTMKARQKQIWFLMRIGTKKKTSLQFLRRGTTK